jgi:hypothetical protein
MQRNNAAASLPQPHVDSSFSRAILIALPLAGLLWAGLALLLL